MDEKKQLKEEQLEKVSGGAIGTDDPKYEGFSGFVNMYSLQVGSEYYFTCRNETYVWFRGKVLETWEKKVPFKTERTHRVQITDTGNIGGSWSYGEIREIYGDGYAAYTTKN